MKWFYVSILFALEVSSYTDKELECFEKEKVLHAGTQLCHKLLTRGPCSRRQWFVLDKPQTSEDSRTRGVCKPIVCPDDQLYWPATGSCVSSSKDQERLCGKSQTIELRNNYNGEGECLCRRDPLHARQGKGNSSPCYKIFTQGPCAQRMIFAYADADSAYPGCLADPCHKEKLAIQLSGKRDKIPLFAKYNGTCYELETTGPCPDLYIFKVGGGEKLAGCYQVVNQVFDPLVTCSQDVNGNCGKIISKKKTKGDKFSDLLFTANAI